MSTLFKQPDSETASAALSWMLHMGDNAVVLSHRASEWCGHGPALEEDIALANTALDLLGQAQLWLNLAGELEGKGRDADALAYHRDGHLYNNALLVELPNEDIGNTIMRHFLFDAWHTLYLSSLESSSEARIAEIASKANKEAAYHLERTADLVIKLGDGTDESHQRMQNSLDNLWSYAQELTAPLETDALLSDEGIIPDASIIATQWLESVTPVLLQATLDIPKSEFKRSGGRLGRHTEHLGYILAEMQFLPRAYPGAVW